MDVYDSPLNLAHQQARHAEAKFSRSLFEEAICCHQRAADYLREAINLLVPSSNAMESLTLQLEYHLRQLNIVREFQRRKVLCAQRPNPPAIVQLDARELPKAPPVDHSAIYREYDTLIQCLDNCDGRSSEIRIPAPYQSASKIAKDDRIKLEEQRAINESLRTHVMSLMEENDKLWRDVEKSECRGYELRERLRRASVNPLVDSCVLRRDVDDSPFDLPPLEVPQFDFDLLSTAVTFAEDGSGH